MTDKLFGPGTPFAFFRAGLFILFGIGIFVTPNVFREEKLILLLVITMFWLSALRKIPAQMVFALLLGVLVTFVYLVIGLSQAAEGSFINIVAVYVVSPVFWTVFCTAVLNIYGPGPISRFIFVASAISGALSVAYVYLFLNFNLGWLQAFIEDPNVTVTESGVIASRLHLYGSIVFSAAAIFASPPSAGSRFLYLAAAASVLAVIAVSGRAATLVSMLVGLAVYAIANRDRGSGKMVTDIALLLCAGVSILLISQLFGVNLAEQIRTGFFEKVLDMGGEERIDQAKDLMARAYDSYFLGVGHGIPVSVIRADEHPWRYELLTLSTVFHTGFIGLLIYGLPAIFATSTYLKLRRTARSDALDHFYFAGLIAGILGTSTNPYFLSVEFQWIYFLPCVYFSLRRKAIKLNAVG